MMVFESTRHLSHLVVQVGTVHRMAQSPGWPGQIKSSVSTYLNELKMNLIKMVRSFEFSNWTTQSGTQRLSESESL